MRVHKTNVVLKKKGIVCVGDGGGSTVYDADPPPPKTQKC